MKILIGLIAVVIFLLGWGAFYLWTGRYDVAATKAHSGFVSWLLEEVRDRSIQFHSKEIKPRVQKDPKAVQMGFREYHAMCRLCHGAPGYPPSEFARGLYPKPPDLGSKEAQRLSEAEFYWVIKNGVKMTGMPAFGPTHEERELWAIVAFLKRIPNMQNKEYEAMSREATRNKETEGHHHGGMKH